jgi:Na+-transporting NADH:ubiquinone oxidoreductase subunit A
MIHRITRGLRLPIAGQPEPVVDPSRSTSRIALVADDYIGLRPAFRVGVGDAVRRGQVLFEDRTTPGVRYTSTAEGKVVAIHRGARRAFQSLVIELSSPERSRRGGQVTFSSFTGRHPSALAAAAVRDLLLESGLWTALRARPYSRVANPADAPRSIFVTAMDTDPLAPEVEKIIRDRAGDFERGLAALGRVTTGPVFCCTSDRFTWAVPAIERVRHERFAGPHPAGTAGLHIHVLDPAGRGRLVWHVGYQDVLAIGRLFGSGALDDERIIALGGPAVRNPRLLRTRLGAAVDELTAGELQDGDLRTISGSVFAGRTAAGPVFGYLGRYHRQICALPEGRRRELLGWAGPGFTRYSAVGVFFSNWLPRRHFAMTTSTNGSPRAIVPIGVYEKVMPFDLVPTYLLKALLTHDVERAEQLGCLELDEEDLALCTFVCPGKHDYGGYLREVLSTIEKDG